MDQSYNWKHNPVPYNIKKKEKAPFTTKCGDNKPFFNIYKVSCDNYNNRMADINNPNPSDGMIGNSSMFQEQNKININNERFEESLLDLDKLKKELDGDIEKKYNSTEGYGSSNDPNGGSDDPFWVDDCQILWKQDRIMELIPTQDMPPNRALNSMVRLSVLVFLILAVFGISVNAIFIPLIVMGLTYSIKDTYTETYSAFNKVSQYSDSMRTPPTCGSGSSEKSSLYPEYGNTSCEGFVGDAIRNNPLTDDTTIPFEVHNSAPEFDDRMFKSSQEAYGDLMEERNKIKSWDPFCPQSMTKGGFEKWLYGDVKRHLYY